MILEPEKPKAVTEQQLREDRRIREHFISALKEAGEAGKTIRLSGGLYGGLVRNPPHTLEAAEAVESTVALIPSEQTELPAFLRNIERVSSRSDAVLTSTFGGHILSVYGEGGYVVYDLSDAKGSAARCRFTLNATDDFAYMDRINVRPDRQGEGLNGLMTRMIVESARKVGKKSVRVVPGSPAVVACTVRDGFEVRGEQDELLPQADMEVKRLVIEGGLERGERRKRRKYKEAMEAFKKTYEVRHKGGQRTYLTKLLTEQNEITQAASEE
ncbi:Uncharacterised protein [uncultured archaeon]|nr:Uncharacterised protein [uncultured archaeon]